jgi:putative hydrolase of the HAD superfamily
MPYVSLETVFLDAGGVLVYPNWNRISDALGAQGVILAPSALAAAEPRAKRQLDATKTIQVTNDTSRGWLYFNLILEHAGVTLTDATNAALQCLHTYHAAHNLWELVPPHVPEVLSEMRRRGLRLVVVSNANGTLRSHLRKLGLDGQFDCVLDSCEEGVEKPDPRIFHHALDRSGADPATTIHVGDLYEVDVVGARAAGIRAVLLDEGGLYAGADCVRVRSLRELLASIDRHAFD